MTDANRTYRSAEAARERSIVRASGCSFSSVKAALAWWVEARVRLSSPNSPHPHTEPAPYARIGGRCRSDTRVLVQVEGGRGGDLDGVLATIATIGSAVDAARRDVRPGAEFLLASVRDGVTYGKLAETHGMSSSTVSAEIGRAEFYLLGLLKQADVVV